MSKINHHMKLKFRATDEEAAGLLANTIHIHMRNREPTVVVMPGDIVDGQQLFEILASINLKEDVTGEAVTFAYSFLEPHPPHLPEQIKEQCELLEIVNPYASVSESALVKVCLEQQRIQRAKQFWENKAIKDLSEAAQANAAYMNEFIMPMLMHIAQVTKAEDKLKELLPTQH